MCQKGNKVLSLFCSDLKRRIYLREISKLAKIPLKTASRALGELEDRNIVRHRVEGKHKYFELNMDNIETKFYLVEAEIYKTRLFLDKYPVFRSFLKDMVLGGGIVVSFGSFTELRATKDSDLDVLTVSDKKMDLPEHLLPYKVNRISMNGKQFLSALNRGEPLIMEILAKHTVLCGHSYFIDVMWWYYGKKG